jgi:hypothetical protein
MIPEVLVQALGPLGPAERDSLVALVDRHPLMAEALSGGLCRYGRGARFGYAEMRLEERELALFASLPPPSAPWRPAGLRWTRE